MIHEGAAARVLSEFSPVLTNPDGPLFPSLKDVRDISSGCAGGGSGSGASGPNLHEA